MGSEIPNRLANISTFVAGKHSLLSGAELLRRQWHLDVVGVSYVRLTELSRQEPLTTEVALHIPS